jgi:uncharacterized protein (TIGR03435 family)
VTRAFTWVTLGFLFSAAAFGQASGAKFDVASVKPVLNWPPAAPAAGERGAAGSSGCPTSMKADPARVDFRCATLGMLIGYAYRISPDRVAGPDWMMAVLSPRFNIEAILPRGASKDQVPDMFQSLLADRFKLAVHRGTANLPVYALVVARGGVKIDRAAPRAELEGTPAESEPASSKDGFYGTVQSRTISSSSGSETIFTNPRMGTVRQTGDPYEVQRWDAPDISLGGLADLLENVAPLALPVIDMTGLDGRYRLILEVSLKDLQGARLHASPAAAAPPGAGGAMDMEETVLSAFNKGLLKLGLRLERRKGPVETIVVDNVEKTPTGN